jgi:hypothetical protein
MAIGSALAVTGCSQSPSGNPDKPVEATYVPHHEASASGDDGAPLDANDDGAPLDADDDVPDAPAVEPPPPSWPDGAFTDAALGTHVDGGFVCVNPDPQIGQDPLPTVCNPKTQYCCDYDYDHRASEGCYAFDAGPLPTPMDGWTARCSYNPHPTNPAGPCTCWELDDAGALAVSCGSCYGSPPARRRRNGAEPLRLAAADRRIRSTVGSSPGSRVSMRRS